MEEKAKLSWEFVNLGICELLSSINKCNF
jgi:hypothetical protein